MMSYINCFELTAGKPPYKLFASVSGTFQGINIYVGGGTDPHIGSVAISIPRASLEDPNKRSCTTSVFNCIGHKDDIVAKIFSEAVCIKYDCVVTVSAGIHIDNASSDQIDEIKKISKDLLNSLLIELEKHARKGEQK
ncbi:MAG: hypothetical protein GX363_07565 [Clostridiales bacterium]|jgi:hypothetical protein|nr:hypothetical protein [Clostridiales bacterium]